MANPHVLWKQKKTLTYCNFQKFRLRCYLFDTEREMNKFARTKKWIAGSISWRDRPNYIIVLAKDTRGDTLNSIVHECGHVAHRLIEFMNFTGRSLQKLPKSWHDYPIGKLEEEMRVSLAGDLAGDIISDFLLTCKY